MSMNINSAGSSNNVAFCGDKRKTEKGNKYEKSSIGLNTGLVLPTIGLTGYDVYKEGGFKGFMNTLKTDSNKLKSADWKLNLLSAIGGGIVGGLIDLGINKYRAQKADDGPKTA